MRQRSRQNHGGAIISKEGESCTLSAFCAGNLKCIDSKCQTPEKIEGMKCTTLNPLNCGGISTGFYCLNERCVLKPGAKEGESCRINLTCGGSLKCINGQCQPREKLSGMSCSRLNPLNCGGIGSGYSCQNGQCALKTGGRVNLKVNSKLVCTCNTDRLSKN